MLSRHAHGIAITAIGVLVLSPDTLFIRLLGADLPTTLFWRGVAMAFGLFAFQIVRDRGPATVIRQLRHPHGWGLGLLFAASNILFVTTLAYTSVADTLGCLATASIFAALFSTIFLGESAPLRMWITSAAIALGLCLIAFGGAGSGFGRFVGILAAMVFGSTFVFMRAIGDGDTLPGLALGAALIAPAAAFWASPLSLDVRGAAVVAAMAVVLPLAFGLIGRGPRYLPAPEVSLLMLLETVFGTLWAWLFLAEAPTRATLIAIAIILSALSVFYVRQAQVTR